MANTFTSTSASGGGFNAANWLKSHLPDGYNFSRNGLTVSMNDAIAIALAMYAAKAKPHLWAVSELWNQIASAMGDETIKSENLNGWAYTKETAVDRASNYKMEAEASEAEMIAISSSAGSFQSTTATYPSQACNAVDEYST